MYIGRVAHTTSDPVTPEDSSQHEMNQTTDLPASSAAAETTIQFSRANVFGMFLTLQLCQLTQPYGSLLFRRSSGFLWRVNPIASFTEALIIITYLGKAIWATWKEGHGFEWKLLLKSLRATASALLLLRGEVDEDDGRVLEKLLAASFLDDMQTRTRSENGPRSSRSRLGEVQETVESHPQPSSVPGMPESYEMTAMTTQSGNQAQPASTPQQGVLRRRTNQLESALPHHVNSITDPHPSIERTRLLRDAFGSNALAHYEYRIDIVTATSVIIILAKIITISFTGGDWVFLLAGYFMVSGWLLVQSLLLIFHSQEMSDQDLDASIRTTQLLNSGLKQNSQRWWLLYLAIHLPILGYLSYLLAYRVVLPQWLQWMGDIMKLVLTFYSCCIGMLSLFGLVGCIFVLPLCILGTALVLGEALHERLSGGRWQDHCDDILRLVSNSLVFALGIPLLTWVAFGSHTYASKKLSELYPDHFPYAAFFQDTTINTIVDSMFSKSVTGLWIVCLFLVVTRIFYVICIPQGSGTESTVSWGNFLLTISVFIYYLLTYDSNGTSKPSWTDWLG